jgi:hypothetical protein
MLKQWNNGNKQVTKQGDMGIHYLYKLEVGGKDIIMIKY